MVLGSTKLETNLYIKTTTTPFKKSYTNSLISHRFVVAYKKPIIETLFYPSNAGGSRGNLMRESGLLDAWIESNVLGPKAAENVVSGKSYVRGIWMHKLTL